MLGVYDIELILCVSESHKPYYIGPHYPNLVFILQYLSCMSSNFVWISTFICSFQNFSNASVAWPAKTIYSLQNLIHLLFSCNACRGYLWKKLKAPEVSRRFLKLWKLRFLVHIGLQMYDYWSFPLHVSRWALFITIGIHEYLFSVGRNCYISRSLPSWVVRYAVRVCERMHAAHACARTWWLWLAEFTISVRQMPFFVGIKATCVSKYWFIVWLRKLFSPFCPTSTATTSPCRRERERAP